MASWFKGREGESPSPARESRALPGKISIITSPAGRGNGGNDFAFVSPIDAKIFVHGDDTVFRIQLAHPNQTKIGQVRFAIPVTPGQSSQLSEMIVTDKIQPNESFRYHFQHKTGVSEMEGGLGQNRFTGQKRLCHLPGYVQRPRVMQIASVGEATRKPVSASIPFHDLAKPFRCDRSRAPFGFRPRPAA